MEIEDYHFKLKIVLIGLNLTLNCHNLILGDKGVGKTSFLDGNTMLYKLSK